MIIKGFDKEYEINNENNIEKIINGVPDTFRDFLYEPAFILEETTFIICTQYEKEQWMGSKDSSEEYCGLLQILLGGAEYYHSWASRYYEIDLELALVRRMFKLEPINNSMLKLFNKDLEIVDIVDVLEEIGYPYFK